MCVCVCVCRINRVCFLWPSAQHCTTWDYYVEMDPFDDGLLFLRGSIIFYNIRKPLHFEDRDLKTRITDFHACLTSSSFVFLCFPL